MVQIRSLKYISYVLQFIVLHLVAQCYHVLSQPIDLNGFVGLFQMQRTMAALDTHDFGLNLLDMLAEKGGPEFLGERCFENVNCALQRDQRLVVSL